MVAINTAYLSGLVVRALGLVRVLGPLLSTRHPLQELANEALEELQRERIGKGARESQLVAIRARSGAGGVARTMGRHVRLTVVLDSERRRVAPWARLRLE